MHSDTAEPSSRILVLTADDCKLCKNNEEEKSNLKKHLEMKDKEYNTKEQELENLYRRHDQLKEKYEQLDKDNKKYAKNLFEALKENTDLKEAASKDAEALEDALNTNQVLCEEI